jgi:hypothetical protein
MIKTVGVLAAGVVGYGVMSKFQISGNPKSIIDQIDKARETKTVSERFPYLEPGYAVALEYDSFLDDIVERVFPYFQFDQEVAKAFAEACGGAAEFMIRKDEVKLKRSIPLLFRPFTSIMRIRLRELRRAIRDKAPGSLEEFDEIVQDVETYTKDSHHNLWCEAHKE